MQRLPSLVVSSVIGLGLTFGLLPVASGADDEHIDDPAVAAAEFIETCDPRYRKIDAAVAEAEAGDASYKQLPGFPYLRVNRLLADILPTLSSREAIDTWLRELRYNDAFAREIELRNLGWSQRERAEALDDMRLCAVWLSAGELQDEENWQRLRSAVKYADAPNANGDIREALASKRVVASSRDSGSDGAEYWRARPHEDTARVLDVFDELPRDELGRVGMVSNLWKALAVHHAPRLAIAAGTPSLRPHRLQWKDGALSAHSGDPAIYYLPGFARVGDSMLLQFTYVMWFQDAGQGGDDEASIGGRVWRVTLDEQGEPLVYDTITTRGKDHRWLLADVAAANGDGGDSHGRVLRVGSRAAAAKDAGPQLQAGTAVRDTDRSYDVVSYDDLLFLPTADGGTRSAFDAKGRLLEARNGEAARQRQLNHIRIADEAGTAFNDAELLREMVELAREQARR